MPRRDDRTLLLDMADAAREALNAVSDCESESLFRDHVWTLGLVKLLEIIGEAAGKLSIGLRDRYSTTPWDEIIGMRNRLVHAYFEIDYEQVWRALKEDLPLLIQQLEQIMPLQKNLWVNSGSGKSPSR